MINSFQNFGSFYASCVGRKVVSVLNHHLDQMAANLMYGRVLTIGYAFPFYDTLAKKAPKFIAQVDLEQSQETQDLLKISEGKIPFPNASFQCVFIVNALEYAFCPTVLLKEIGRVLTPQGVLICITPNQHSICGHLGFEKSFSMSEIKTLFKESFLTLEEYKSAVFFKNTSFYIDFFLSRLPFGAFLITKATKHPLELAKSGMTYTSQRITKASAFSMPRS